MFKAGDEVVSLINWPSWLTTGKTYKVVEILSGYVRVVGDNGVEGGFDCSRFKRLDDSRRLRPSVPNAITLPPRRKNA